IAYRGLDRARLTVEAEAAIAAARWIIIAPSNPMVSICPILGVPGMSAALRRSSAPRIAVSPIVGGSAVSGPAGHMLAAAGHEVSVVGLARLYGPLLTGIVIDETDRAFEQPLRDMGLQVLAT